MWWSVLWQKELRYEQQWCCPGIFCSDHRIIHKKYGKYHILHVCVLFCDRNKSSCRISWFLKIMNFIMAYSITRPQWVNCHYKILRIPIHKTAPTWCSLAFFPSLWLYDVRLSKLNEEALLDECWCMWYVEHLPIYKYLLRCMCLYLLTLSLW